MAAFATFQAAEQRAYTKMLDKTWVTAHAERKFDGTLAVRVKRYMSSTNNTTRSAGAFVEITDDATT